MEAAEGEGRDELGLANRIKALAVADPVLDLERRKRTLDRDWRGYQMEELALTAIDSVTLKMDLEEGARFSDAAADVARVAAVQMPGRDPDEHAAVASWVLNSLINIGTVDRGFQHPYGTVVDGRYERHPFDFKLLREVPGPAGEPRLRAETEAIAVLVPGVLQGRPGGRRRPQDSHPRGTDLTAKSIYTIGSCECGRPWYTLRARARCLH